MAQNPYEPPPALPGEIKPPRRWLAALAVVVSVLFLGLMGSCAGGYHARERVILMRSSTNCVSRADASMTRTTLAVRRSQQTRSA